MPRLRFVHAADLHLDSPFQGLRGDVPERVACTLHYATFGAYENIVDLCLREQVNALLVAGDVYDGADRSLRAQLRFVHGLEQLEAAGIRSFICHGNHDPLDGWEARLDLPPGCVRFGPTVTSAPVFPDDPERATVHGVSFPRREVRHSLSPLFGAATMGSGLNIGLLHANVGGNPKHDSYSPCSVDDLADTGIDYWALGHVHTRQVRRNANPAIVYPGNSQGRQPNELGARGVYLVEMGEDRAPRLEFHPTDIVRWETLELNITGLDSEHQVLDAIDNTAYATREAADGRPVVFRLALTGRGPMHRFLRRPGTVDDILERLHERYSTINPWLWCDRIQVDTASLVVREQVVRREDFLGDLARLSGEMRESSDALAELRESLRELYVNSNAGPYLRVDLPSDEEIRELLTAAEYECFAALMDEENLA